MGKMENTFFKKVGLFKWIEIYPLISHSNVTIWQELGNQCILNESNIPNSDSIMTMENSNNEDDDNTKFCENTIIKFKNLLSEVS